MNRNQETLLGIYRCESAVNNSGQPCEQKKRFPRVLRFRRINAFTKPHAPHRIGHQVALLALDACLRFEQTDHI